MRPGDLNDVSIHVADITVMRAGLCIIGLEERSGQLVPVRPVPRTQHAWAFERPPFSRGARLRLVEPSRPSPHPSRPHVEDCFCDALALIPGAWTEDQLVDAALRGAVSHGEELFGAPLEPSPFGGGARWVAPDTATRSIASARAREVEIVQVNPAEGTIRARVTLASGDVIGSVKVVDETWRRWLRDRLDGQPDVVLAELRTAWEAVAPGGHPSVLRLGLSRPLDSRCWLMLDTVLPSLEA